MRTDREIIGDLWRYGHFSSPEAMSFGAVARESLPALRMGDAVVQAALRSYQSIMGVEFERLVQRHHGRSAQYDGIVGPATRELFTVKRCAVPDYGVGAGAGEGSWPQPCQKAGVKFHIDAARMPASVKAKWPALLASVVKAYRDVGLVLVESQDRDSANIQTWWTTLIGSTIGIAEFNGESCGDTVTCRLDQTYAGYVAGLLCHEWGHNCNLSHTRGGIMNPSILPDPEPFRWPTEDPSYRTLVRYFGGAPVPEPPPAPAPAPMPPATLWEWVIEFLFGWLRSPTQ